ncbi:hypothetical protein ABT282_08560 [Streptomyces sp. NPDC000927]|uniref:hypothetical protein n=1 Tax=Streptomyces sp. NPDC000927 TaxID=3154371 RepID=UPI003330D397
MTENWWNQPVSNSVATEIRNDTDSPVNHGEPAPVPLDAADPRSRRMGGPMAGVAVASLALGVFVGSSLTGSGDGRIAGVPVESPSLGGVAVVDQTSPEVTSSAEGAVSVIGDVALVAERAPLHRSAGQDGDWTAVKVTLTNNTSGRLDVSPPHFIVTDASGGQWSAQIPAPIDGIAQKNVAPGQTVVGTVAVARDLDPVAVTFLGDLFGGEDPITVRVGS